MPKHASLLTENFSPEPFMLTQTDRATAADEDRREPVLYTEATKTKRAQVLVIGDATCGSANGAWSEGG